MITYTLANLNSDEAAWYIQSCTHLGWWLELSAAHKVMLITHTKLWRVEVLSWCIGEFSFSKHQEAGWEWRELRNLNVYSMGCVNSPGLAEGLRYCCLHAIPRGRCWLQSCIVRYSVSSRLKGTECRRQMVFRRALLQGVRRPEFEFWQQFVTYFGTGNERSS